MRISVECLNYLTRLLKSDENYLKDILDNSPSEFWSVEDAVFANMEFQLNQEIQEIIKKL